MRHASTLSAALPLLRSRWLRIVLVAAPGVMASVATLMTAVESSLAWVLALNATAGIIVSSGLFLAVSIVARGVAEDRVSLTRATEEGHWRARAQLLSIHYDDLSLYADWYFRLRLQEEIERSQRYGLHFTLLLTRPLGVHNEIEARATGGWFADHIRRHLRSSDLPALLKDGTLAIVLPHTKRAAALQRRVTKVLAAKAETRTGLACFPEDGANVPALLEAATMDGIVPRHEQDIDEPVQAAAG